MSRYFLVSAFFLSIVLASLAIDGIISVPWYWYIGWTFLFIIITALGTQRLAWQYFMPVYSKSKQVQGVALTFNLDDMVTDVDAILSSLAIHQVKAAFFCTGSWVNKNAKLLNAIYQAGHLVGNLSYHNSRNLYLRSYRNIASELTATDQSIVQTIGVEPRFFRPPCGLTSPMIAKNIKQKKYVTIGWSHIGGPVSTIQKGDIVKITQTDDLPEILSFITRAALPVVRLDDFIGEQAYHKPRAGMQ